MLHFVCKAFKKHHYKVNWLHYGTAGHSKYVVFLCMCVFVCIVLEDIDGHDNWYPKQMCNLDLFPEIAVATICNQAQILKEKTNKNSKRVLL